VIQVEAKPAPIKAASMAITSATPQAQVEPFTGGGGGDSGSTYFAVTGSGKLATAPSPTSTRARQSPTIGV